MANKVGAAAWNHFKKLIGVDAHDTFNKETLTWKKYTSFSVNQDYNEEKSGQYEIRQLEVLLGFNFFRSWPITKHQVSGALDNQNMIALISKEWLSAKGWLNSKGYLEMDTENDRFIHAGIQYKIEGDSAMSQAFDTPIQMHLVLRREENVEGTNFNDQPAV